MAASNPKTHIDEASSKRAQAALAKLFGVPATRTSVVPATDVSNVSAPATSTATSIFSATRAPLAASNAASVSAGASNPSNPSARANFLAAMSATRAVAEVAAQAAQAASPEPSLALATAETLDTAASLAPAPVEITRSPEQLAFARLMREKRYGVLIGYAGTGKTTCVRYAVEDLITEIEQLEIEHERLVSDTAATLASAATLATSAHTPSSITNRAAKLASHPLADLRKTDLLSASHLTDINLPSYGYPIAFCAFTGMATEQLGWRLRESDKGLGNHCFTIHKLLDYGPVETEVMPSKADIANGWAAHIPITKELMKPRVGAHRKLPFRLLIIDEASMPPASLFAELLEALPSNARIFCVGDIAQLPPVFGKPIMPFLLMQWPVQELTRIYRQKNSLMAENASLIRACKQPAATPDYRFYALPKDANAAQATIIRHIRAAANGTAADYINNPYSPLTDIILTPNNVGPVGQEILNVILRGVFNPANPVHRVITMRDSFSYAVGDRVMATTNDASTGIFNGMVGHIAQIKFNPKASARAMKLSGQAIDPKHVTEDDLAGFIDTITAEQEATRKLNKLTAQFGTDGLHAIATKTSTSSAPSALEHAIANPLSDGTGERQASHSLTVEYANGTTITYNTSSGIEQLQLAWAITVHKAQGSGYNRVIAILHDSASQLLFNELLYTMGTRHVKEIDFLTTKFAFQRSLNNQRIKGTTLEEKITSYRATLGDATDLDFTIPSE